MYVQRIDDIVQEILDFDLTPTNQSTFSTDDLVAYADQALQTTVVPLVMRCREEYFVTVYPISVGPATTRVPVPPESSGFRIRDMYLYDPTGGTGANNNSYAAKAKRINPDTLPYFSNGIFYPIFLPSILPQYYVENNALIFYPALTQNWLAKLRVFKRPNHLVQYLKCCGQVLNTLGNNTVIVDNIPTGTNIPPNLGGKGDWTRFSGVNATTVDVLQPEEPFNHRFSVTTQNPLHNLSLTAVDTTNLTVTFASSDAYNSVQVGDYITTNQCSPFIQYIPAEGYQLVRLLVSMRILKAQGDLTNWSVTSQLYNQAALDFESLITPKVENQPRVVGGGNRPRILGNLGLRRGV